MGRLLLIALIATAGGMSASASAASRPAPTPDEQIAKAVAGRYPGNPVTCLPAYPNTDSTTFKGAILYKPTATWYLNRFDNGCPNDDVDTIMVTRSYTGQLCRGDIVTLVDRASRFPRGSCVLGDFTPYTRKPPKP